MAMTASQTLRSPRLTLRSLQDSDIPQIVVLAGVREVAATTLRLPHPYTEADARKFLDEAAREHSAGRGSVFAVCDGSAEQFCGSIGLHVEPGDAHAELGYWIGRPYWGRGYATEAARAVCRYGFEVLQLHRIFANLFRGNSASARVLEKLGMQREGCARQHRYRGGEFLDEERYGMLAAEFRRG